MAKDADIKLPKLNRVELLELLVEQSEQLERLQEELAQAQAQAALQERIARLAEDAMARLAGMLEASQLAQHQYMKNLRELKSEMGIATEASEQEQSALTASYAAAAYKALVPEAQSTTAAKPSTATYATVPAASSDYTPDSDHADAYAASSETAVDPSATYAEVAQEVYGTQGGYAVPQQTAATYGTATAQQQPQAAYGSGGAQQQSATYALDAAQPQPTATYDTHASYASPALAAGTASAAYEASGTYDPNAYGTAPQPAYGGYAMPGTQSVVSQGAPAPTGPPSAGYDISFIPEYLLQPEGTPNYGQ